MLLLKLCDQLEKKQNDYENIGHLLAQRVNEATENKSKIETLETEKESIANELKELQEQSEQPEHAALLQEETKQ